MNTTVTVNELAPCTFEIIDAKELGRRLSVPWTWIKEGTRSRTADPIPHLRFGIYVRFEWGSPALNDWLACHRRGAQDKGLRRDVQLETHRADAETPARR
jgi:hypothetical protein